MVWPSGDFLVEGAAALVEGFVLWSDVLGEAHYYESWENMITASVTLPDESLCRVHHLRTGATAQIPAQAIQVYTGLVRDLPIGTPR